MKIDCSRELDTEPQPLFPMALGIERRKRESLRGNYIDAPNSVCDGYHERLWAFGLGPLYLELCTLHLFQKDPSLLPKKHSRLQEQNEAPSTRYSVLSTSVLLLWFLLPDEAEKLRTRFEVN